MEIQYTGEHLLPGYLGNFFIVLSFVASLLATVSYYYASKSSFFFPNGAVPQGAKRESATDGGAWKKLARISFYIHSASVILIVATLFFMLLNHYYEYYYVWQHSNNEMPLRYIFSCFWEGQEGSFLLWSFWHVVLGNILIRTSADWETPVMTVFSSVQIFLSSMLLGIYFGDYNIGSNPFTVLLREHPDFFNAPIFQNPGYLTQIDGRGLNPLLQNYWMTIHPPTLFLGFALTLVPFSFAISGLWKKRFTEWLSPALPWAFIGIAILGIGVLMGGAWAYEALSFGGFWAWDPVENASLVPWITLVGAGHIMIVQRKKVSASGILFFLAIITFLLILYSTFLTRSGILGDASVHAFTDLGMSGQLLIYLLFYLILAIILFFARYKEMPKSQGEDNLWSREFWMFIGALVLLVSAFQITATTSIPVVNKILGTKLAPPTEAIEHYNAWQVPIAIIIALVLGISQHLKYKNSDFKKFIRQISISIFLSFIIAFCFGYFIGMLKIRNLLHLVLLFSSLFAVFANLDYFIRIVKGKIKKAGSSLAHAGFGLILLGALISQSQQKNISTNVTGVDITQLGKDFQNQENTLLFIGDTVPMGNYFVTYKWKKQEGVNVFYEVEYLEKTDSANYVKEFSLFPRVQTNPRMGNVSEPDTRHFWEKDIYTHVTYAELEERNNEPGDFKEPETYKIAAGDTVFSSNAIIVLEEFNSRINRGEFGLNDSDLAVGAHLRVMDVNGKKHSAFPVFVLRNNTIFPVFDDIPELGLRFTFEKIYPQENKIDISVFESKKSVQREFIIMKAIVFPFINILWVGCLLFFIGTLLAVYQRVKVKKEH